MPKDKGENTTGVQDSLKKPVGPEGTPCIAKRLEGTVRSSLGKVFRLGDTVNTIVDGKTEKGVIAAIYMSPYEVYLEQGERQDEVDDIAINVKGLIKDVILRELLAANPYGPVSRCENLQCTMERTDESKRKDPLVDNLMEAGLFKVETTHFAKREQGILHRSVLENGDYLNVIAVVADGQRRIPRLFYGSHSHAAWRVSPTLEYDRGDILYDKGSELWERSPDEYSYTQSTRIHRELARTLDKLVEKHGEFKKQIWMNWRFFNRGTLRSQQEYYPSQIARDNVGNKQGINTFYSEAGEFDFCGDKEKKAAVDAYKILDIGRHLENPGDFLSRTGIEVEELNEVLEEDDRLETQFPGFVPEFTEANLLVAYERHHHLVGKYTVEVYETPYINIGGCPCRFEWEMAYDESGRVWIEGIDLAEPNWINSYGAYCYFINSGLLTQKPFEYKDMVKWLKEGKHFKDIGDRHYCDMTPLLDHLQPVRKFRVQRGIKRPSKLGQLASRLKNACNRLNPF